MRTILAALILSLALAVTAGARAADVPQPAGWKAVLIAGDNHELAFDNAVDAMAMKLASFGVPPANITILKASGSGEDAATIPNIKAAFAALKPGANDGCFVYITSHGSPGHGLVLARANTYLSPRDLDGLLQRPCRDRSTVVIASGCFSGIFADGPPLVSANRAILTAARDDRPSFGCNANLEYTVFDRCILESLQRGIAWRAVMDKTRTCVSGNEWDMRVKQPSEPQLAVGMEVANLLVFGR